MASDIQIQNRKDDLGSQPVGKLLVHYSIPAVIGMAANAFYNLADAIFVGQGVGTLALGALSISWPVQLIIFAISISVGVGAASIISRALGAGDDEKASRAAGTSFALITLFSLVVTVLGLVFVEPLLRLFGATEAVLPYAVDYMSINFIGAFFFSFSVSASSVVRAEGNARVAMTSMLLGTGVNLALDPLFIFGFGWGISGAALATVIATICSFLYLVWYLAGGKSLLDVSIKHIRLDFKIVAETMSIGASEMARLLAASLLGLFVNNSIAVYGSDVHLAILVTVFRLYIFASLPIFGIGQGLQPIIGFNYGKGEPRRVKEALKLGYLFSLVIASIFFIPAMLFSGHLLSLFNRDPMFIREGVPILRTIMLLLPLIGAQRLGFVLFQAIGKPVQALLISISPQLSFLILVLSLPPFFGLWGVWFSFPVADIMALVITIVWLYREIRALGGC